MTSLMVNNKVFFPFILSNEIKNNKKTIIMI